MIIKFSDYGKSLGTRALGNELRIMIVENILNDEDVVFDFQDVVIVSNSFADECFGKILDEINFDTMKGKTKFVNLNKNIRFIIKEVLNKKII